MGRSELLPPLGKETEESHRTAAANTSLPSWQEDEHPALSDVTSQYCEISPILNGKFKKIHTQGKFLGKLVVSSSLPRAA